jgi:hypothetical protein
MGTSDAFSVPVKYVNVFHRWLDGEPIDSLAEDYNLTMTEMDDLLRQMVHESLARERKKKSRGQKGKATS